MQATLHPHAALSDPAMVTRATVRAAIHLQIGERALARIIGVSQAAAARMISGHHALPPNRKSFELALLLVRLYQTLDALAVGDDRVAARWLTTQNTALNGVPLDLIQTVSGLSNVLQYLEARRGH